MPVSLSLPPSLRDLSSMRLLLHAISAMRTYV
jgi:hypothetical protein